MFPGVQILLEAASGVVQRDADVVRGSLRVLCNCVCQRKVQMAEREAEERIRREIRKGVREKNGIKVS